MGIMPQGLKDIKELETLVRVQMREMRTLMERRFEQHAELFMLLHDQARRERTASRRFI